MPEENTASDTKKYGLPADDSNLVMEETIVIAYRPGVAKYLGSIEAAIFFQQLSHWSQYVKRQDGFFYKSAIEIEQETCISERTQRRCRKMLIELGWIDARKEMANGHPTYHYRVNVKATSVIFPTGKTPVPTGNLPVPTSKNASSITLDNNIISYGPNEEDHMLALHKGYIRFFKINTDEYDYADSDTRDKLIESALKRYKLTPERKAKLHTRLQDSGFSTIKKAIINANKSDWNHGKNPSGWTMDLYKYLLRSYEQVEDWANRT